MAKRRAPRPLGPRLLLGAGLLAAALFALLGGEYSTFDLLRQGREQRRLEASVDSLQRVVDSLRAYHRRLTTDPELQERIAREEFGMVRGDRELLYRLAAPRSPADSSAAMRR